MFSGGLFMKEKKKNREWYSTFKNKTKKKIVIHKSSLTTAFCLLHQETAFKYRFSFLRK